MRVTGTKWTYEGSDHTFVRMFGPIKATICRRWGLSPEPTDYYAFLSIGDDAFSVPIHDLGVPWHDDKADTRAAHLLEKQIKATIRGWLRDPKKAKKTPA